MKRELTIFTGSFAIILMSLYMIASGFAQGRPINNKHKQFVKPTVKISPKNCIDSIKTEFLGIDIAKFYVEEHQVGRRESLNKIIGKFNYSKKEIKTLTKQLDGIEGFESIKTKQKYFTFSSIKDSVSTVDFIAFELDKKDYLIIDCNNKTTISIYERPIDTIQQQLAFVVNNKVNKILKAKNINVALIDKINQAFNNKISVGQLRTGDTLRVLFSEYYINGSYYETGAIQSAEVITKKKNYFVTSYQPEGTKTQQYLDEKGTYTHMTFLKSPLKNGRLTSRFNLSRFHPVLMEVRAHLGTDFAAPKGTPILATADGIVEVAGSSSNNGNFVKIKHDKVYETQYLHMSKIEKGMKKGIRVKQGQVIGYVGSTGLATGPHVCYRFWKNGKQIDPLKEKLNVSKSIPKNQMSQFEQVVQVQKTKLHNIIVG